MSTKETLGPKELRTPRAAAIAGLLFGVLMITSQLLVWVSIPVNPAAADVIRHSRAVSLALNLLPFAGIAFLWFIAVMRSRLGNLEDHFFATVFMGSGLLYCNDLYIGSNGGWTHPSPTQRTREPHKHRRIRAGARPGLSNDDRIRKQDGRRVHVLDFYDLAANYDCSALDRLGRLRFWNDTIAECWHHCVGFTRLPTVGIPGQCCHSP